MKQSESLTALKQAFPHSLPILAAFLLLGISSGLYAHSLGLAPFIAPLLACIVYTGTLEFVLASQLTLAFDPLSIFLISCLMSCRHLFYSISLLSRYGRLKKFKGYLIFSLCDETFAINSSANCPKDISPEHFYFWISALNQLYWVAGVSLGSFMGATLAIPTRGISFVMCALFICIFLDSIRESRLKIPGAFGLVAAVLSLLLVGKSLFMLPTLALILLGLVLYRKSYENREVI